MGPACRSWRVETSTGLSGRPTAKDLGEQDGWYLPQRQGGDRFDQPRRDRLVNLTNNPADERNPIWSPDSSKIAFESDRDGDVEVYTMDRDGSDVTQVTSNTYRDRLEDWQPILKGYPRPISATPDYNSLVVAYEPCSSPTKVHESALPGGSCTAQPTSDELTVGTADSNARPTKSTGFIKVGGLFGDPNVPGDQADVRFTASISDVRNRSDLLDYTGELEAPDLLPDHRQVQHPLSGGPGPGHGGGRRLVLVHDPLLPHRRHQRRLGLRDRDLRRHPLARQPGRGQARDLAVGPGQVYDGGADGAANTGRQHPVHGAGGVCALRLRPPA